MTNAVNVASLGSAMTATSSGNVGFNSGYGSVATAYGCRAWVNFNGTGTVAIRASGNVTSITDLGTGQYSVNFTTAMFDANYAFNVSTQGTDYGGLSATPSTTSFGRYFTNSAENTYVDQVWVQVAIFR